MSLKLNMGSQEFNNLKYKMRISLRGSCYWRFHPDIDPCDCAMCPGNYECNYWFCNKLNQGWIVIFPGEDMPKMWSDIYDEDHDENAERLIEEEVERRILNLRNEEINLRPAFHARPPPPTFHARRPDAPQRNRIPCKNLFYDETIPKIEIKGKLCHVTRPYLTGSTCWREDCIYSHPGDPDWKEEWDKKEKKEKKIVIDL